MGKNNYIEFSIVRFSYFSVVFLCYFGPGAVSKDAGDLWEEFPPSGVQIRAIVSELYPKRLLKGFFCFYNSPGQMSVFGT